MSYKQGIIRTVYNDANTALSYKQATFREKMLKKYSLMILQDVGEEETIAQKDEFIPPDEECPLRDAANQKIPKLTVKVQIQNYYLPLS